MDERICTFHLGELRDNRKLRRTLNLFFLFGLPSLLFSCHIGEDGKTKDNIKLSSKTAEFDASGGVKTITTKGDSWWIENYIFSEGEYIPFENHPEIEVEKGKMEGLDPSVIYDPGADQEIKKIKGPWYTITKDSRTSLILETLPNDTGLPRSFVLHVTAGNYFDRMTVSQSAE